MTHEELRRLFRQLKTWKRRDVRAPHKCLLALWAIGRCLSGESRMAPFRRVDARLEELLREFGPPRQTVRTHDPFWRLARDGVWELDGADGVTVARDGNPTKSMLRKANPRGGLTEPVYKLLRADRRLLSEVARDLLSAHFPESLHDDILLAVGIDPDFTAERRGKGRPAGFREAVLLAYERRCAVCGFDVRIGARTVAIDAAHIRWRQAVGPDHVQNGIALCVLHHKLFDKGAFTLSQPADGSVVLVSEAVVGTTGFDEWLGRYHRQAIRAPIRSTYHPAGQHLDWHLREVFQPPERQ